MPSRIRHRRTARFLELAAEAAPGGCATAPPDTGMTSISIAATPPMSTRQLVRTRFCNDAEPYDVQGKAAGATGRQVRESAGG